MKTNNCNLYGKPSNIVILFFFNLVLLLFSFACAQPKIQINAKQFALPKVVEKINEQDGTVLVWIPSGSFLMGNNDDEPDEKPQHRVVVNGFWMGKFEITNAQYKKFLAAQKGRPIHGTDFIFNKADYMNVAGFNQDDQPVVAIKYEHARAYVRWAALRLPTEAEWEYAAKSGQNLRYATADGSLSHDLANYLGTGGRDIWLEHPSPVGSFPPNPFGLYDMAGNAWEWTSSSFWAYPFHHRRKKQDTTGYKYKVLRGGSWNFGERYCRTTDRYKFTKWRFFDFSGFRLAKDAD